MLLYWRIEDGEEASNAELTTKNARNMKMKIRPKNNLRKSASSQIQRNEINLFNE
jgi:hypothetical protein